jgi:hypothetical protein
MFCAPGPVFGGIDGVWSSFQFCAPGVIFGGTECVVSRFHVLRSRTPFWRYLVRRVPFSCFALLDTFSAVPTASGPVFMFCSPELFFCGTEGVGSRIHVLRSQSRFRRYRGVGSCIHVLRSRTHFGRYRGHRVPFSCFASKTMASGPAFIFCAPGPVFVSTERVGSHFHVLRSRTHFRRYRGRRVPFSCFALLDPFLAVLMATVPVFLFCATGPIFCGTDDVRSRLNVLPSRNPFRQFRGRQVSFSCFALTDPFSAVPRRRVPLSCFALSDPFSAVPTASGLIF